MKTNLFKSALGGSTSLCSAVLLASVGFASAAQAQEAEQSVDQVACNDVDNDGACDSAATGQTGEGTEGGIVVTGSRIARPSLESTVPILSVAGESFIQQGTNNIGDTLNELPQLRSTRQQQNASTGIGISGLNLLDLRGLGTNRTLVLVNGRRHVAADITSNAQSPDVNTIPNDLIERVDIVTGGNSAIYGSDAIAGVVNFILKKDFDGVQIRGSAGITDPGGYGSNQYVSALAGMNFADGRGNVTVHGEYAHQDRILASEIPALRIVEGLGIVDVDAGTAVNGSDGNPDANYFRDIRSRSTSRNGIIFITQPFANPQCGLGAGSTATNGTPYNCLLAFGPDGSLAPSDETARFSTGPIGGAVGGTRLDTQREDDTYSIIPRQDRYNFNLLAHYEFSPALDAFLEGKYVRIKSFGSASGYAGIQGTFSAGFDQRERIRLDNPYLTPAQRTTIANAILASGCNTSVNNACNTSSALGFNGPLTQAQRDAIAAGTYRFALGRSSIAKGPRDESFDRETYRIVAGLRGTFNDDWNYEISANYGRMNEDTVNTGYIDAQRLALSLDAGRNPVTGQIQCRSQFDPAAAIGYDQGIFKTTTGASRGNAGQAARLAADIAACVPFNPFGAANNSAAQDYFSHTATNTAWIKQQVYSAFVSGDTSEFFNLWGGPIRFALGAEYRSEDIYYKQDDYTATPGNTNNVVLGTLYDTDPFKVKEAFAELQVPILADRPFFEELTLSGAARIAKYNVVSDPVWAYNVGIDYAPIRDIRFRANYSRAVRAPFLTETTGTLVANFSPGFVDPCSTGRIGQGTQYRAANCAADLAGLLPREGTYSLQVVSGFNPDLQPEKSDSWTFGAVIQPRWIRNLSLTVDYYDIKVNGIIASPTAQVIADSCYDQPTLDNVFCRSFTRFRGPGTGPFSEDPGHILGGSLLQAPLNYAARTRRGIDTQLDYRTNLTDDVRLKLFAIYTHNFEISNFENPGIPDFENRILGELGDPQDEFRIDTDISIGKFTFGHSLRYIGKMTVGPWENYNSLGGRAPQNLDASPIIYYPEVFYHNFRLDWDVDGSDAGFGKDFTFYVGVDNAFNKVPPLGASGAGAGGGGGSADRPGSANSTGAIYDVRGRQFYAGFRAKF